MMTGLLAPFSYCLTDLEWKKCNKNMSWGKPTDLKEETSTPHCTKVKPSWPQLWICIIGRALIAYSRDLDFGKTFVLPWNKSKNLNNGVVNYLYRPSALSRDRETLSNGVVDKYITTTTFHRALIRHFICNLKSRRTLVHGFISQLINK